MTLLSASLLLAYTDGSHVLVQLPVTERQACRRNHLPPVAKAERADPCPEPDVAALVAEFFGQPFRRVQFLSNAQSAGFETRVGFFQVIDDLGESRFRRLTKTQQAVLAELHDFHCESSSPIDAIDRDYYLDTNGGE